MTCAIEDDVRGRRSLLTPGERMTHLRIVLNAGRWLGSAAALAAVTCAFTYGCGCGPSTPVPHGAPAPSASGSESTSAAPSAPSAAAAPAAPVEIGFDPASVVMILDDPRLADVKAAADREAYVKAVELLAAALRAAGAAVSTDPSPAAGAAASSADPSARAGAPPGSTDAAPAGAAGAGAPIVLEPAERAAWLFQLGKLRALAGDPLGAAKAYEECAGTPGPLVDHARYMAADIHERAGHHQKALDLANGVAAGLGIASDLELVLAPALEGTGDIDGAAKVWRAHLARGRRYTWVNTTLRFANALLKHPSDAHNEEAVVLARTIIDGSGGAGVGEAKEIEKKAMGLLPVKRRKALEKATSDTLLARAKRLLGAGQLKEALKVTEPLMKGPLVPRGKEAACDAHLTRARILDRLKRKAESADAYEESVEACKDTSRHVEALFNAGKALSTTGHYAAGVKRLEELEKAYPTHRLADDARYRRALAARANADEVTFAKLLSSMPDDYPSGDMVNDGLFELGLHHAEKRAWTSAMPPLSRGAEREKERRERIYHSAGRFGYFLGRALLETGHDARGKEVLTGVIQGYPLTYYMSLAYARLAEKDPAAAKRAVDEAVAREAAEPFYVPPHPQLESPTFKRAVELVRQGELRLARAELDLLGVGDRSAPREVLWASALLFARAGAPTQSHGVLRSAATTTPSETRHELTEWLEHYPAGKWRAAWELAFPRPFLDIVSTATAQAGIPEPLAYAIMREESAFEPRVVSSAQAYGLMQLIAPTAKRMAKPLNLPSDAESLKRPAVNIPLGCRYLGQLRKQFPDNTLLSIPGYNAGGGAPKRWLKERAGYDFDVWVERIPYDETQKYTKRVIGTMAAYEWLYWQERPTEARAAPLAAGPLPAAAVAGADAPAGGGSAGGSAPAAPEEAESQ